MRPDLLSLALAGGDDYELLFTAPMDREAEMARISEALSVPITRIGVVEKGTTIRFLDGQGQTVEGLSGWQHF